MSRLQDIIARRGKRQAQIAELLGKSPPQVSRYVKNPGLMTLEQLEALADFLRCRVSDLTGETELDAPRNGHRAPPSRASLRRELEEIDRESVRWIRAWLCRQPDPPNGLVMLESRAEEIRAEIAALDEAYGLTA